MAYDIETKPPQRSVFNHLHSLHEKDTWQYKLGHFLERPAVEAALLVLLFVDICCVVLEGGIDLSWWCFHGHQVAVAPERLIDMAMASHQHEPSSGGATSHASAHQVTHLLQTAVMLPVRLRRSTSVGMLSVDLGHGHPESLVCEGEGGATTEFIEEACHHLSIGILCLFFAENLLKMSMHFQEFFSRTLHVIDFVVVTVSLICDAVIAPWLARNGDKATGGELELFTGVLLFFRIWRVIRVMHGIFEVLHAEVESTEKLEDELKVAQRRIRSLEAALAAKA